MLRHIGATLHASARADKRPEARSPRDDAADHAVAPAAGKRK